MEALALGGQGEGKAPSRCYFLWIGAGKEVGVGIGYKVAGRLVLADA